VSDALAVISNERDFEADAAKNKKKHIFVIKPRKAVEKVSYPLSLTLSPLRKEREQRRQ
jgi:hypothetical protein